MAKQFNIPAAPSVYRSRYAGFVGCDFTSDAFSVDDRRFPDALNLMLDVNGYPEKRPGITTLENFDGEIHLLRRYVLSGKNFYFIYAGTTLHVRPESLTTVTYSLQSLDVADVQNCFLAVFSDGVYGFVKHSDAYQVYLFRLDGEELKREEKMDAAYVPTTSVAGRVLTADNLHEEVVPSAGFETLEPVNLLTSRRINTFKIEDGYVLEKELSASDVGKPYLLDKPMLFYTDSPVDFPDETKKFLTELYLKAFFIEKDIWVDFFGNDTEYNTWQGHTSASVNKGVVTGTHAKKLISFLNENLEESGTYRGDVTQYRLNDNALFSVEIFLPNKGYVTLPMCAVYENFKESSTSGNSSQRVVFFWHFAKDLPYGTVGAASEVVDWSRLQLCRLGHLGQIADSADYPGVSFEPDTKLSDNVRISYCGDSTSQKDKQEKIFGAKNCTMYGVLGNSDRLFVTGNGDESHYVRYSDLNNPLYFPDLNYIVAGTANTKVVSMFPSNGSLVVAKEPNGQDVNMFLVQGNMSEGEALFTVSEGVPGVGVVSPHAVRLVDDSPHFLSDNGVMALISNQLNSRVSAVNRSFFADPLILKENLLNASMAFYRKMLILAFPDTGNCFVFNTKDKTYSQAAGTERYVYECWRWNNIHATCFLNDGKNLLFGTKDGKVKMFKFDVEGAKRYNDDGDRAIEAYFCTKSFDDGSFMTLKNMRKRGCGIALKPFARSSCSVAVVTDSNVFDLKSVSADVFNWEYIDFTRFDFSTNTAVRIIPFNQKVKKYATIQFVVKNDALNESFGVLGIEKAFTIGNFKKN